MDIIKKFDDGSIGFEEPAKLKKPDFYGNLAPYIDHSFLNNFGRRLKEEIEDDKKSQQDFLKSISETINLLGISPKNLNNLNSSTQPFEGSSQIYSQAMLQAIYDILSSTIPIFSKLTTQIDEESHPDTEELAQRKVKFFEDYLQNIDKSFQKESEKTILWSILAGNVYKKVYIDPLLLRPVSVFINPEDLIIRDNLSSHYSTKRKTHKLKINPFDFKKRIQTNFYARSGYKLSPLQEGEQSVEDGEQDLTDSLNNILSINTDITPRIEDSKYHLYECHCLEFIPEDFANPEKTLAPYIVTLDAESGIIIRITRNWKAEDPLKESIQYFVNYYALPAFKGEGYGMVQLTSNQAQEATSLLRQITNSSMYANFPALLYAGSDRIKTSIFQPEPGSFTPIGLSNSNRIQDSVMALPYKDPSPVLLNLKDTIEDNIRKISSIFTKEIVEQAPNAPASTILPILESFQKVPNMILGNFFNAFREELSILNERFKECAILNFPFLKFNSTLKPEEFFRKIKIIPANDATYHNSSYRLLKNEIILKSVQANPEIHDVKNAYRIYYENLGLSKDIIERILQPDQPPEQGPIPLDPITENKNLILGMGAKAAIEQAHEAHIEIHSLILQNENQPPEVKGAAQAHIQEHMAFLEMIKLESLANLKLPEDPSQLPMDLQNRIALQVWQALKNQQSQEAEQAPPPPLDPAMVELEGIKSNERIAAAKNKLDFLKLNLDEKKISNDQALKAEDLNLKEKALRLKEDESVEKMAIKHSELSDRKEENERENERLELEKEKEAINIIKDKEEMASRSLNDRLKKSEFLNKLRNTYFNTNEE